MIDWVGIPAASLQFRGSEFAVSDSFFVARTPVTVAQFGAMVDESGYKTKVEQSYASRKKWAEMHFRDIPTLRTWQRPGFHQKEDHPVVCINSEDAEVFCSWLGRRLRAKIVRLPSLAEWLCACGAEYLDLDWQSLEPIAWYESNAHGKTHSVGRKSPNGHGLFDVRGNIWEWCAKRGMVEDFSDFVSVDHYFGDMGRQAVCGGAYNTKASEVVHLLGSVSDSEALCGMPQVGFRPLMMQ